MKNIKYLFLVVAGALASCTVDYDRTFDQSAAERMSATLEEYQKILVSAPNGWTMDYYAEYPEARTGGYIFVVSFDAKGFATLASETDVTESGSTVTAERITSPYELIADQGPVLTFNTYNRLLHQFVEPQGSSDTDGDAGDYEFVFMKVSSDEIIMKGKKNGNTMTLKALPADADWDEYIGDAMAMDVNNYYPMFEVSSKGADIGVVRQTSDRKLKFMDASGEEIYWDDSNGNNVAYISIIYTPEGFHLYEPVEQFGVTFDEFIWDAVDQVFKSPDGNIVLTGSYPAGYYPYDTYLKTFKMTHTTSTGGSLSRNVTITQKSKNKTYTVANFGEYPYTGYNITATYDRETSELKLYPQNTGYVSAYGAIMLRHVVSVTDGFYTNANPDISYTGVISMNGSNKMVLTFASSAIDSTIGVAFLDTYYWPNCVYINMIWTEQ